MSIKDLFTTKKEQPIETVQEIAPDNRKTFIQWGKELAEQLGGYPDVIHPALHSVYLRVKQLVAEDEQEQEKRRGEVKSQIGIVENQIKNLNNEKERKEKDLQLEEKKIEENKAERELLRKDPSSILGEKGSPKASLFIGVIIILFLTVYLFVFYSSAAYSAFFKNFMDSLQAGGDIGVATSIFDPQAVGNAARDGITEIVLILTIPAVFLGLGFLIHKFTTNKKSKTWMNYLKVGGLILVTFLFDSILAYGICKKIYDVTGVMSFSKTQEPYSLMLAAGDIDFWTIIFAGFVVYIIWGLVFNFVMDEYYKLDRVKVALDELEKKISERKQACKSIKDEISNIGKEITEKEGRKNELNSILSGTIVKMHDVKLEVNNFVTGWLSYMEYRNFSDTDRNKVVSIKDGFLAGISNQFQDIEQTNK